MLIHGPYSWFQTLHDDVVLHGRDVDGVKSSGQDLIDLQPSTEPEVNKSTGRLHVASYRTLPLAVNKLTGRFHVASYRTLPLAVNKSTTGRFHVAS